MKYLLIVTRAIHRAVTRIHLAAIQLTVTWHDAATGRAMAITVKRRADALKAQDIADAILRRAHDAVEVAYGVETAAAKTAADVWFNLASEARLLGGRVD